MTRHARTDAMPLSPAAIQPGPGEAREHGENVKRKNGRESISRNVEAVSLFRGVQLWYPRTAGKYLALTL